MKRNTLIIPAIMLVATLAACGNNETSNAKNGSPEIVHTNVDNHNADAATNADAAPGPSATLPSFSLLDLNDQAIELQQFRGKKVFVNLWATWCPPCRREMPSIEKLLKTIDTSKVAFVMISLDDQFDKAKKYIRKQQLNLPVYYPAQQLPALFNVDGIPSTFIFDEHGQLIRHVEGSEDYNTDAYRTLLK